MINPQKASIKDLLEEKVRMYNQPVFIEDDPISIPHQFSKLQDIEISGFWTAMLSWGQRKTIINKARELMLLMDNAPYDFILNHTESDLKPFLSFKHRTFQPDDTLYFIAFFKHFYTRHSSLEEAFAGSENEEMERILSRFHDTFFSLPYLMQRTRKHVSSPAKKSSCKRLNMFLRWMVRSDNNGVDFGLWDKIGTHQLMIPLDVHVFKIAHRLGLLHRTKPDWQAVVELTHQLTLFDPEDPVKYDFALFSMGVLERE